MSVYLVEIWRDGDIYGYYNNNEHGLVPYIVREREEASYYSDSGEANRIITGVIYGPLEDKSAYSAEVVRMTITEEDTSN